MRTRTCMELRYYNSNDVVSESEYRPSGKKRDTESRETREPRHTVSGSFRLNANTQHAALVQAIGWLSGRTPRWRKSIPIRATRYDPLLGDRAPNQPCHAPGDYPPFPQLIGPSMAEIVDDKTMLSFDSLILRALNVFRSIHPMERSATCGLCRRRGDAGRDRIFAV